MSSSLGLLPEFSRSGARPRSFFGANPIRPPINSNVIDDHEISCTLAIRLAQDTGPQASLASDAGMENPPHSSPFKEPSMPTTPLRQLSAEQVNAQRMPLPQSPSLHSYLGDKESPSRRINPASHRDSISVSDKVAFLNNLSNPSSPTRQSPRRVVGLMEPPATSNAAFQRAVLGYEESQASLSSMKAENERLAVQVSDYRKREMKIAERIESLLDQLQTEREERKRDKDAYVGEVKKCRKQAYKAEMQLVETREELKECKGESRKKQVEIDSEKQKKEDARQESFERAYAVQGLTEEVEILRQKIKVLECERDQARSEVRVMDLQKREIDTRVQDFAFEKASRLQSMKAKEEEDTTPRPAKRLNQSREDHDCSKAPSQIEFPIYSDFVAIKMTERHLDGEEFTLQDHINELYGDLKRATTQLQDQKELNYLMNMECQFNACPCRHAERRGKRYVVDVAFEERMVQEHTAKKRKIEEDEKFQQLPPEPSVDDLSRDMSEPLVMEAMQVPLPSPKAQELESTRSSLAATTQLEEMTQVIVEPGTRDVPFTFSMSSSDKDHLRPDAPPFRHTQSALGHMEDSLFDMSPPKQQAPRPSTSMGFINPSSPIRLVPDSPQPNTLQPRSSTPLGDQPTISRTMRVALKDSSPQHPSHRRAQSRPNIRSQSRARSPLVTAASNPDFSKSTSASPAPTTAFPITPKHARSRTQHEIPAPSHSHEPSHTITTTTTIPLRNHDNDDTLRPFHADYTYESHTQPLNINLSDSQSSNASTSSDLLNMPGTPVSREAALAQIRARRDRARSINLKKGGADGMKSAPGSARRGIMLKDGDIAVGGGMGKDGMRDVSVASLASAPGRFGM